MTQEYYKLFACCIPVKGYVRSAIYDIQRNDYWFIPNDLCDILLNEKDVSISKIKEVYKTIDIDSYFHFLFENEICFSCDKEDLELFPKLDQQWHIPFHFETAIVDFNKHSFLLKDKIVNELNEYAVPNVQFRFYDKIRDDEIKVFLRLFVDNKIKFIELILKDNKYEQDFIEQLIRDTPKLRTIVLTDSKEKQQLNIEQALVYKTKEKINSEVQCGLIQVQQFVVETRSFCESTKFNSCLNCKISIDQNGNIKNCPSMWESFGNIRDTSIAQAITHPDFKKYWHIKKDNIEVCKDCEFRHMCTDCRAYIKQTNNIYSQPAKCNYNPYIARWEGDEGYISVLECGAYNEDGKFVVNSQKVEKLNQKLWGE